MTGKDVLVTSLKGTKFFIPQFLNDLSDADLLVRPVPGANHVAWQLGHLISSEVGMVKAQLPDAEFPPLPAGFEANHNTARSKHEGADGFLTKAEYLGLFEQVRAATIEAVGAFSDADLDRATTGSMAGFAPTLGAYFLLVSDHTLLHAGQFGAVRRKLGKPVVF